MTEENNENKNNTEMSKQEKIGFHKGALATLSKERQELSRLLQIVEQIMKMHIAALKEEGVDLEDNLQATNKDESNQNNQKPPIDELI